MRQQVSMLSSKLMCWKQEKWGSVEDSSEFDKGPIVIARRLGQSTSETAELTPANREYQCAGVSIHHIHIIVMRQ